jgi:hypothetical protein
MSLILLVRGPLAMVMLGIRHSGHPLGIRIRHSGPLGMRHSGPLGMRHSGPLGIRLVLISRRLFSHRGSSGPLGIRLSRRLISHRGSSGPLGILNNHRQLMLVSRRLISQVRESKLAASNIQHQDQPGPGEAVLLQLIRSLHRYRRLQFSTLGER